MFLPQPKHGLPKRRWGVHAIAVGAAIAAGLCSSSTSELKQKPAPTRGPAPEVDDSERWVTHLLDRHTGVRRATTARPELLRSIEVQVGVPVRLPQLEHLGARWISADVVPWQSRGAARLRYRLRRYHVTVYVYDADRTPLRTVALLRPRVVQNEVVFVAERRGYAVAVIEKAGLGHAVVSDLSADECARLAAAILSQ